MSQVPPPVGTPVLLKHYSGRAYEASFWNYSSGNRWEWLDADGEVVYSYRTCGSPEQDDIEWSPLPGQLLPMHCLKPEMGKVIVFTRYQDSMCSETLWFSAQFGGWYDADGGYREITDSDLGFLPVPTDAAGLTVLEIEAMP